MDTTRLCAVLLAECASLAEILPRARELVEALDEDLDAESESMFLDHCYAFLTMLDQHADAMRHFATHVSSDISAAEISLKLDVPVSVFRYFLCRSWEIVEECSQHPTLRHDPGLHLVGCLITVLNDMVNTIEALAEQYGLEMNLQ